MTDYNKAIENITLAINNVATRLDKLIECKDGKKKTDTKKNLDIDISSATKKVLDNSIIKDLLNDYSISDILINGPFEIYIDRHGKLEKTEIKFSGNDELLNLVEVISASLNRKIDPNRPLMDARLPDGSRVNIIMPPMAVDGITISIRKFSKENITLEILEKNETITPMMRHFLEACTICKLNIVISGGTGSGKTTLLNALSQHIPSNERILSIEDSMELRLQQPHVVRLESKIPEIIGDRTNEVNIRDLLNNSLRMRPDRIIIGEVRGEEAYDMIQAMNTGHDGSITTVHANNPREAIARIENMISQTTNNTSTSVIRKQITSAVNLIIHITREEDGRRKVTNISEIIGIEGDTPIIHDIFSMQKVSVNSKGKPVMRQEWSGAPPRHGKLVDYIRSNKILRNEFPK
jgi:pilus assembly protein CpaF